MHNLLKRSQSPKKNVKIEVAEDMQGKGEIMALDPSQESEKTRPGSEELLV